MRKLDNTAALYAFGGFLKAARSKKGYTQKETAFLVGMHQTYYGKIERGQREVDFFTALKICKVLDADLSEFIKSQM